MGAPGSLISSAQAAALDAAARGQAAAIPLVGTGNVMASVGTAAAPAGSQVALLSDVKAAVAVYDLLFFFGGLPVASQPIGRFLVQRSMTLPHNLIGSQVSARVLPTSSAAFAVTYTRDGGAPVAIGTLTLATNGTFTLTGTTVSLVKGDIISIAAPAVADATLQDISITLSASIL